MEDMILFFRIIRLRGDGTGAISPPVLGELRTTNVICEPPIVSRAFNV